MREQHPIANEYAESWDCGTYQTGASKPHKRQSVLITVLLMAVIFLGGLASVLGVMNVRLLTQLMQQENTVLPLSLDNTASFAEQIPSLSRGNAVEVQGSESDALEHQLGFKVREINELCRQYWDLTAGLEVFSVLSGDCQLQEGDILLSFDGELLTSISQLHTFINRTEIGHSVKLEVLRGRQSFTVELTVENEP